MLLPLLVTSAAEAVAEPAQPAGVDADHAANSQQRHGRGLRLLSGRAGRR